MAEALLSLKEIEYCGQSSSGDLPTRRDHLISRVLGDSEQRLGIQAADDDVRDRVRAIRSEVVSRYFGNGSRPEDHERLLADATAADLAQELMSYPDCYLQHDQVTDTRIVETIQRMQESFLGKADVSVPLRVIVQCDEAIVVPPEKAPRGSRRSASAAGASAPDFDARFAFA